MDFAPPETLLDEVTDFLMSEPTPERIIAFKPSEKLTDRLQELQDKINNTGLTDEERVELNRFLEIDHLFTMLKAKARLKLMKA